MWVVFEAVFVRTSSIASLQPKAIQHPKMATILKKSDKVDFDHESIAGEVEDTKIAGEIERHINQPHAGIYAEAIARYPNDEAIDQADEAKLKRKLDKRIIPLLGICYFFYYVDKTTLSYAAIFGIKADLSLGSSDYSI